MGKYTIKPGDKVISEGDSSMYRDWPRWIIDPDSVAVGMPRGSDWIVYLDWLNLGRAQAMRKLGLPRPMVRKWT